MTLGHGVAIFFAGLLQAVRRLGELSRWILGSVVAAASVGSRHRSFGSVGRCLVCGAQRWSFGSVALGIFGFSGFP